MTIEELVVALDDLIHEWRKPRGRVGGWNLPVMVEGCDCEGAAVGVALVTEGHGAPYVLIYRGESDGMYLRSQQGKEVRANEGKDEHALG